MKKTVNFNGLSKVMLILAAVIIVAGALVLAIFGGGTAAAYTAANLGLALILKAVVATVLVCALVLLYFVIRFRKDGVKMGIFSSLGAVVSGLMALALCVVCRAPLGNFALAVVLTAVCLSYIASALFFNSFVKKSSRKKNSPAEDSYNDAANKAFAPLIVLLAIFIGILVGAFVGAAIYGSVSLMLYALPTLLTAVLSILFTLAFSCRLYAKKA
ncbi:MAG: hypothetical protein IJC86_01745 [Clostridia bacterium]|nr:hypothetical protein [Clostridia bacterium]